MDQKLRDYLTITAFGTFAAETDTDLSDIITPEVVEALCVKFPVDIPQTAETRALSTEIVRQIVRDALERITEVAADSSEN